MVRTLNVYGTRHFWCEDMGLSRPCELRANFVPLHKDAVEGQAQRMCGNR